MLAVSRLYSFLDHKSGVNVHFLEGQKLIHDLVLLHPKQGNGFAYFRDTFLAIMPIIFYLKPGESLGIYIDSEDPYFRLKIETNSSGHTRTLLLPEEFNLFPEKITGKARITKITQHSQPYTSMIELNDLNSKDVINQIFSESYQTNSEVIVAKQADQSMMITKLPPINVNVLVDETESRKQYIQKQNAFFEEVFDMAANDIEKIVQKFEAHGLAYLGSRQIDFFCPCSQERMVLNLRGLYAGDLEELYKDQDSVEIKCDYCRKEYHISKADILGS